MFVVGPQLSFDRTLVQVCLLLVHPMLYYEWTATQKANFDPSLYISVSLVIEFNKKFIYIGVQNFFFFLMRHGQKLYEKIENIMIQTTQKIAKTNQKHKGATLTVQHVILLCTVPATQHST